MKDLKANIAITKNALADSSTVQADLAQSLKNQIAMMEALQDIQENMMRIEGKMRNIK
jgi:translation initiation factor IF-1